MKHFTQKSNRWLMCKALEFFANYIDNHDLDIGDNDTFDIFCSTISHEALEKLIKQSFSATMFKRLQNCSNRHDRLDLCDCSEEMLREIWVQPFARKSLRTMLHKHIAEYQQEFPTAKFAGETFPRKMSELVQTLGLSEFERDILLVFIMLRQHILTISDGHNHRSDENDKAVFVAKCLDCDTEDVLAVMKDSGKLRRYQCVDDDWDFNHELLRFLNGACDEPLSNSYFKRSNDETLPWDFYGDLVRKHGDILKRLIRNGKGSSPVNILLYGAPGTGKTSFAKTLAAELGMTAYCIAQNTGNERDSRSKSSPEYRFGALQICNAQIEPARSVIIVDEADEMLRGSMGGGLLAFFGISASCGDKGLLNNVLDEVTTPTIWITNTAAGELDESSRRRFDYSIRFDPLNGIQRLAIWRNNVAKQKLEDLFPLRLQETLANRYPVSAGGITMALRNAARLNPAPAEVEPLMDTLLKPHCELLGVNESHDKMLPVQDYSLEGLNIKSTLTLPEIENAVRNFMSGELRDPDRPRMNLLFSGAPGTGKTEFVKYLGKVLDRKILVRMGSDLLDKYVGGTEQNIRAAFAEAEAEHAILFLDEIDGLVQSRDRAQRSWEVTQVNELLYQMENFSGVMIGATNFAANLDPAVLRRFTFKLEFDYLDNAGKKLFFERMFKTELSAAEERKLNAIPRLAPGDFRTVRQSLFYLGGDAATNAARLAALERESAAKQQNRSREAGRIGF